MNEMIVVRPGEGESISSGTSVRMNNYDQHVRG